MSQSFALKEEMNFMSIFLLRKAILQSQMQNEYHRVPVTALAHLREDVLFAGQGTALNAYDVASQSLIASTTVFQGQAIHGVVVVDDDSGAVALVYGGQSLCTLAITRQVDGSVRLAPGETTDVHDWILDASWHGRKLAVVTAHNALHVALPLEHLAFEWNNVTPGSNSILYSAHVKWLSASQCLIASGTAFGDVVVWSHSLGHEENGMSRGNSQTHYIFSAHQGSVFGVRLFLPTGAGSDDVKQCSLVTCSDDRTVKLWNLSDLVDTNLPLAEQQRETGFGSRPAIEANAPDLLSSVLGGHLARIWHVRFLNGIEDWSSVRSRPHLLSTTLLLSFGEDATGVVWALRPDLKFGHDNFCTLQQIALLKAHSGKHIWSVSVQNPTKIATGGADGAIAIWSLCVAADEGLSLERKVSRPATPGTDRLDVFRAYGFVDSTQLLATTDQGRVLFLSLNTKDDVESRETLWSNDGLRGYSVMSTLPGIALFAGKDGVVHLFRVKDMQISRILETGCKVAGIFAQSSESDGSLASNRIDFLVTNVGANAAKLCNISIEPAPEDRPLTQSVELSLPSGFIATSFVRYRHRHHHLVVLGSRNGCIAVYEANANRTTDLALPLVVAPNIHGKETVTWLKVYNASSENALLLSTGRDGTFAAHFLRLDGTDVHVSTIHHLALPFGPNVEGMGLIRENCLRIWGFRGKQFVVYDLESQQEVMKVECGGAHRIWSFDVTDKGGTFMWTKASQLYHQAQKSLPFRTINSGGHGRELKCTAVSSLDYRLIATGAEDTDIKLSTYREARFQTLHSLQMHNTGVQHLAWSNDSKFLFSSGGFEEFFVWRITYNVPMLNIGAVCESSHPNSGTSDLRIMSFDVREGDDDYGDNNFEIVMVYSDSTIRIWHYHDRVWELMISADYLTSCLTQCFQIRDEAILTAATDGHIALWSAGLDRKTLFWSHRSQVHQSAILSSCTLSLGDGSHLFITGGDDNAIGITRVTKSREFATLILPKAHAAAVTGLAILEVRAAQILVVSAGIDQRVKLWCADIDITKPGVEGIDVKLKKNVFTAVADVSVVERFDQNVDGWSTVLVSGVGMDLWRVEMPK